jgi:hypothetical protein
MGFGARCLNDAYQPFVYINSIQQFIMSIQQQVKDYIKSQPEPKRADLLDLHKSILQLMPKTRLWFLDGKNEEGKIVSNPNIGYGSYFINYADGSTKEFYQVGLSANTSGISVYVMGLKDKTYLPENYGKKLGKANVTGYCIKFKSLQDIDTTILKAAILDGVRLTSN